jgi:hypothetical protein
LSVDRIKIVPEVLSPFGKGGIRGIFLSGLSRGCPQAVYPPKPPPAKVLYGGQVVRRRGRVGIDITGGRLGIGYGAQSKISSLLKNRFISFTAFSAESEA